MGSPSDRFLGGVPFCETTPEERESETADLAAKVLGLRGLCKDCAAIVAAGVVDVGGPLVAGQCVDSLLALANAIIDLATAPGPP